MVPTLRHARASLRRNPLILRANDVTILKHARNGAGCSYTHTLCPLSANPKLPYQSDQRWNVPTPILSLRSRCSRIYHKWCLQKPSLSNKRWIVFTPDRKQTVQGTGDNISGRKWTTRTIELPVGGNGHISLEIKDFESSISTARDESQARDILIYLPPGIARDLSTIGHGRNRSGRSLQDETTLLRNLALPSLSKHPTLDSLPPVIVEINYRLTALPNSHSPEEDHRFPTPIHDVSVAFDWILENQDSLRSVRRKNDQPESVSLHPDSPEPRIFVFGSHIGGSLALMLALTKPNEIHAVAVRDPITDWVSLDEVAASTTGMTLTLTQPKKRNKAVWEEARLRTCAAADALIDLRTQLFRNPSGFFDAFASPLLFLRAPGHDTPSWRTARPEIELASEDAMSFAEAMKSDGGVEVSEVETRELIRERGYGPYDDDWHTTEPEFNSDIDQIATPESILSYQAEDTGQMLTDLSSPFVDDHKSPLSQSKTDLSPQSEPQTPIESFLHSSDIIDHSEVVDGQAPTDLSPVSASISASANLESHAYPTTYPDSPAPDPTISPLVSSSPRRRKVLRRWPPLGRPEDVDLPYVKIYSTLPPADPRTSPQPQSQLQTGRMKGDATAESRHFDSSLDSSKYTDLDLAYVLHPQARELVNVMKRACFWGRESGLGDERVVMESIAERRIESGYEDLAQSKIEDSKSWDDVHEESSSRSPVLMRKVFDWLREIRSVEK